MIHMIELTGLIILYLYGVLDINFVTVLPGTIMFTFDYMISYYNTLNSVLDCDSNKTITKNIS